MFLNGGWYEYGTEDGIDLSQLRRDHTVLITLETNVQNYLRKIIKNITFLG